MVGDKRNILILIGLLIVFAAIFFLAFVGLQREETLFDIGIPAMFENWLIMFLSLGSIGRIVWELYKR
jgi:hypothetical protein